jgi:hypothetical protein
MDKKPALFVDSPASKELHRLSKAALIDVVIDCCKRMFGEDVFAESPNACLNEVCQHPLRMRRDKNPWDGASGTAIVGQRFDDEPYKRLGE